MISRRIIKVSLPAVSSYGGDTPPAGRERAIAKHLADGSEFATRGQPLRRFRRMSSSRRAEREGTRGGESYQAVSGNAASNSRSSSGNSIVNADQTTIRFTSTYGWINRFLIPTINGQGRLAAFFGVG